MAETDNMLWRKQGHIGVMVFNNPQRHNAVSLAMWERMSRILADFEADEDIRAIVLTGAGTKAFVSGADISRFEDERASKEAVARYNATTARSIADLANHPKPTLAMIRGYCIGGGLAIALSCDIRIASSSARFALPAAKLGLGYDYPGLKHFVEIVGPSFAKEIFFTARQFDAEEARAMGLVNRVAPDGELESFVKGYSEMIAANAPLTLKAAKFAIAEALKDESHRDLARCSALVQQCFQSRDYEEGRRAFMEKRKPAFQGR